MDIRFFAAAAAATGIEVQAVDLGSLAGSAPFTLEDLSKLLVESFPVSASASTPPLSELLTRCSFLVNEVSQRNPAVTLASGDVVDVLPPFAGG
ncbi:molybdopterin synthase sulfur carrier subunit [Arthrobacter livingstonensis]|uniref:Molybdopterin synthase sulfur carrier subunit n=1 Tax=Arthrobacter livingstonensis TaxID=670078 RepID=A0A2V5L7U3_9MICC|nr:MoaD/ThiS family protein [Arthrobacter livingstonensis]PYI65683.1 molybdopterin synthase sulfur carrier subunit [Arthrobacter livingstonensis]